MGAWGVGSFDNDDGLDWVAGLVESDGVEVIAEAFGPLLASAGGGYLEAPDCSIGLAAAEAVAALGGRPSPDLPDEVKEWAAERQRTVAWRLKLSPDEALTRIRTVIDPVSLRKLFGMLGRRPFIGRVRRRRFWVQVRPSGRNSFAPVLRGTVRREGWVTTIQASIGTHPIVHGFLAVWFEIIAVAAAVGIARTSSFQEAARVARGRLIMLAFGIVVIVVGRMGSDSQAVQLVKFVSEVFGDDVLTAGPPA